ncbi:hypothetical protein [Bacteroides graminisolvens]|uniref:hypothetical protein n=1 Tax=Bacteroides graminisolvens TaxID=477666 RepID=UPI0029C952E1|nr:hypothetical protein [Bacteroides graminisolvens]
MTQIEHDRLYQEIRDKTNHLESIIATYFPELYDYTQELDSRSGAYWIQQRLLLATSYDNDKEQWIFINNDLLFAIRDYSGYIGKLRRELINIAIEL